VWSPDRSERRIFLPRVMFAIRQNGGIEPLGIACEPVKRQAQRSRCLHPYGQLTGDVLIARVRVFSFKGFPSGLVLGGVVMSALRDGGMTVPIDGLIDQSLATNTTRRTVVKTGVKIAYAAPIVAASFKLSAHGASAAVSGNGDCFGSDKACQGDPNFTFCQTDVYCATFGRPACICSKDTEGNFSCSDTCNFTNTCTTSKDCSGNYVCKPYCGVNLCSAPCGEAGASMTEVSSDPTLPN
jgi:hypothetical protein